MARITTTQRSSQSGTTSAHHSESTGQSITSARLDEALRDEILSGLSTPMTDAEIARYAENLLKPQLNAKVEASQQTYETERLMREQEIEELAASLQKSIGEQQQAYRRSMTNIETAALARGMGRSSYTLEALANQGDALAEAIRGLTEENEAQKARLQDKISLAARQNAQTQGRLKTDFAMELAAKTQEMKEQQRREGDQHYLTATSAAMGKQTESSAQTDSTGSSSTHSSSTTVTTRKSTGSTKKAEAEEIDAISGAAKSTSQMTRLKV